MAVAASSGGSGKFIWAAFLLLLGKLPEDPGTLAGDDVVEAAEDAMDAADAPVVVLRRCAKRPRRRAA